jgi:hypothetical protein
MKRTRSRSIRCTRGSYPYRPPLSIARRSWSVFSPRPIVQSTRMSRAIIGGTVAPRQRTPQSMYWPTSRTQETLTNTCFFRTDPLRSRRDGACSTRRKRLAADSTRRRCVINKPTAVAARAVGKRPSDWSRCISSKRHHWHRTSFMQRLNRLTTSSMRTAGLSRTSMDRRSRHSHAAPTKRRVARQLLR